MSSHANKQKTFASSLLAKKKKKSAIKTPVLNQGVIFLL